MDAIHSDPVSRIRQFTVTVEGTLAEFERTPECANWTLANPRGFFSDTLHRTDWSLETPSGTSTATFSHAKMRRTRLPFPFVRFHSVRVVTYENPFPVSIPFEIEAFTKSRAGDVVTGVLLPCHRVARANDLFTSTVLDTEFADKFPGFTVANLRTKDILKPYPRTTHLDMSHPVSTVLLSTPGQTKPSRTEILAPGGYELEDDHFHYVCDLLEKNCLSKFPDIDCSTIGVQFFPPEPPHGEEIHVKGRITVVFEVEFEPCANILVDASSPPALTIGTRSRAHARRSSVISPE